MYKNGLSLLYNKRMFKKIMISAAALALISQNAYATTNMDSLTRFNEYYNNGVMLFKANKYSSAILEFKKVLRAKPYDNTVRNALISCYLARADFYVNQSNEPKKAIVDFKNALFYMKYWGELPENQIGGNVAAQAVTNLASLEARYGENQTAAQRFETARILRTQGELSAAGYDFAQLFNNSTYSKQALENAGDIYKALNNQAEAINSYRRVLKLDEKNARVHYKYALILDEAGNVEAAAEEFNLALKYGEKNAELLETLENLWISRTNANPSDAQAFMNLAIILQKKGDFQGAQSQYRRAIALAPNDMNILYNLASLYEAQNDHKAAIGAYDRILLKEPTNKEVLFYKAQTQEKIKDFKSAIETYKKIATLGSASDDSTKAANADIARIINSSFSGNELLSYLEVEAQSNPSDFNAQYDFAFQAHKAGQHDKAIQYYKNALNINPKYVDGYLNLANLYSNKNDFANAKGTLDWGLNMLPNNAKLVEAKRNLEKEQAGDIYKTATKYWDTKNYKMALETYLKIPIQTPEVLSAIAACYFELGDYQNAIEYYKKILAKNPKDLEATEGIAGAYMELNDEMQAEVWLKKVLTLNPNNADAKNALELIAQSKSIKALDDAIELYEKQEYDKAMTAFYKIHTADPKNAYAYYYKALIFEEQKKPKDAIGQYKKAVEIDPKFSLAVYGLATALDNAENYKEAVENYDKYLALRAAEGTKKDDYIDYVKKRNAELKTYLKGTTKQ